MGRYFSVNYSSSVLLILTCLLLGGCAFSAKKTKTSDFGIGQPLENGTIERVPIAYDIELHGSRADELMSAFKKMGISPGGAGKDTFLLRNVEFRVSQFVDEIFDQIRPDEELSFSVALADGRTKNVVHRLVYGNSYQIKTFVDAIEKVVARDRVGKYKNLRPAFYCPLIFCHLDSETWGSKKCSLRFSKFRMEIDHESP